MGIATGAKRPFVAATIAMSAPMTFMRLEKTCAIALPERNERKVNDIKK